MEDFKPVLTDRYQKGDAYKLSVAEELGAYQTAKRALATEPAKITEEVKKSNIRGRGGAGFPTGVKWGFLNPKPNERVYLVINADESEPGTFKDRTIMEFDPHRLIEGNQVRNGESGLLVNAGSPVLRDNVVEDNRRRGIVLGGRS